MLDQVLQQNKKGYVGWIPRRENFNANESTPKQKAKKQKKTLKMVQHYI